MQLSENFTLAELTVTSTMLPNRPNDAQLDALKQLAKNVLQPLRSLYGRPIDVNSGFRSVSVNISVGGAKNSQHCKGEAADLSCDENALLFNLVRNHLDFDQLIWEGGNAIAPEWVHVSYKASGNRKDVLQMRSGKYTAI
ncbi:MAG TPA: peptidase M15 [Prolixibacteraceae bacterium]|nr:peptidase M15 [Prolixibacteraceae bacterium]